MPKYSPGATRYPVYQISNPQDLGTLYYIQVVVQRASDLSTVVILDLVAQGNGLYGGVAYQIPQDPSGQGYELFETISVYTDSGYTTLSPNYEIVNTPIDVGTQISNSILGGAGGGGSYDLTDYQTIRKIIAEELVIILSNLPKPGKVVVNTENFEKGLSRIMSFFDQYKGEINQELVLHRQDVARGFEGMNNNILGLTETIPKYPFENLVSGMDGLEKSISKISDLRKEFAEETLQGHTEIAEHIVDLEKKYQKEFDRIKEALLEELYSKFQKVETLSPKEERPKVKEEPKTDYLAIAESLIRKKKNA